MRHIIPTIAQVPLLLLAACRSGGDPMPEPDIIDPVYVSFRPSAEQQYRWRRDPALQRAVESGGTPRVQAVLPDGAPYPVLGRIGFVDPVVDASTGTQQFRAEFPSADRLLQPGQFVRVKLLGLVRMERRAGRDVVRSLLSRRHDCDLFARESARQPMSGTLTADHCRNCRIGSGVTACASIAMSGTR